MTDTFGRFTRPARHVLTLAQESAQRLYHKQIGTEHLLVGLIRDEQGLAGDVLRDQGLDVARVEQAVESMSAKGQAATVRLELADSTKRAVEAAVQEARKAGQHNIGTAHLLLGVLDQESSPAITILEQLGTAPASLRESAETALAERWMEE